MTLYDRIGGKYADHRLPDPRLTRALAEALPLRPGSKLLDVGAGTGKYARALAVAHEGVEIVCVEPAATMIAQAAPHPRVTFALGVAEELPVPDASVDGVFSVIALSHFPDLDRAFGEMVRVRRPAASPGQDAPIVVVTIDPRLSEPTFFSTYFPEIAERNLRRALPLDEVRERLAHASGAEVEVSALPIPRDFVDLFTGAAWSDPARYLDAELRACSASFAGCDPAILSRRLQTLADDLASGALLSAHPEIRDAATRDVGLRVLITRPTKAPR